MNNSTKDYPQDVKDIIRYTKIRKQYPELDKKLREEQGYSQDSITLEQMYWLLRNLQYTILRTKYPELDKKIREQKRYKEPLKPAQMNQLIQILQKEDSQCNN